MLGLSSQCWGVLGSREDQVDRDRDCYSPQARLCGEHQASVLMSTQVLATAVDQAQERFIETGPSRKVKGNQPT